MRKLKISKFIFIIITYPLVFLIAFYGGFKNSFELVLLSFLVGTVISVIYSDYFRKHLNYVQTDIINKMDFDELYRVQDEVLRLTSKRKRNLFVSYINKATAKIELGEFIESGELLGAATDILPKIKNKNLQLCYYITAGRWFLSTKNFEKTQFAINKINSLFSSIKNVDIRYVFVADTIKISFYLITEPEKVNKDMIKELNSMATNQYAALKAEFVTGLYYRESGEYLKSSDCFKDVAENGRNTYIANLSKKYLDK